MTQNTLTQILSICNTLPAQLKAIPPNRFSAKQPGKWSRKEILGHLTDSATVNIQRFIRGQLEDSPQIYYAQDEWVAVQAYQSYNNENLINLWESLNRHLVSKIPDAALTRTCTMKNGEAVTLLYLAEDYLSHLQHHIRQLLTQDDQS